MADKDNSSVEYEQDQSNGDQQQPGDKRPLMTEEEDPSLLVRYEEVRGSKLGDIRVRRVVPARPKLRRVEQGMLEATTAADAPQTGWERATMALKRTRSEERR